jgi:4-amino-4-deoxy-L-arabinose transferase-like glycosyltransferase
MKAKLLLLGILCLFLAQEACGLQTRWVEDETWYLLPAQSLLREGKLRIPVFNTSDRQLWAMPPVLTLLEAGSWAVHDLTIPQARLLTVGFGLGSILCTFLLGSRLAGERVGLLAALLCAVDNMLFLASRTVRPEALVLCFSLLALWLLLKSVQDRKLWPAILAGVAVGAGMSTHPNGAVAALCGLVLLLFFEGWRTLRQPRLYAFAASCALAFLPYLLFVVLNDAGNGFESLRALGNIQASAKASLLDKVVTSAHAELLDRYWGFAAFPYRLHVALLAAGAVLFGLVYRSRVTRLLATCAALHLLYFLIVTNANKSPRYLTLVMPFIVILWAQAILALWRWATAPGAARGPAGRLALQAAALGLFALAGFSQFAGNVLYLVKYRNADLPRLCRQVDELVPRRSTIYGGMAFWINLRQHTYIPYQRMPWKQAVEEFRPTVLILDDRVMVQGSYAGEWDALRAELHEYADRHGRLLGNVRDPFYGDLAVYEVTHPDPGLEQARLGRPVAEARDGR